MATEFESEKCAISGYLRDVVNTDNDYSFIFGIILSFYQQGFAKYFDETIDKDYKQKMRFGDILQTNDNKYMVLDINNEMRQIGEYDPDSLFSVLVLEIPLSICQVLSNAILFYSQIEDDKITLLRLNVKYNDKWIIKQFGGPLNAEFESITIIRYESQVIDIVINYGQQYSKQFKMISMNNVSYKDINKFFEIRKDENNLCKIRVSLTMNDWLRFGECKQVSVLWDQKTKHFDMSGQHRYIDYIGPKNEEDKMNNYLRLRYKERYDDIVKTVKLKKEEYISDEFV